MINEQPDDELNIPRATLNKMIKELLPDIRVSIESRELISNCCTEFITYISSESNELCNAEQKKTISPDHVITALGNLGFPHYIEEAKDVLKSAKNMALKKRKGSSKLENLGIPEDVLYKQQQELFAKGRREQEQRDHEEWNRLQAALNQNNSDTAKPDLVSKQELLISSSSSNIQSQQTHPISNLLQLDKEDDDDDDDYD